MVDGDTLLVEVDLGFGITSRQYLRLRGINTPELNVAAGKKAKRFVKQKLGESDSLVIHSTRSDKYDRYLADVFYFSGDHEIYLNNALITSGYAVLV